MGERPAFPDRDRERAESLLAIALEVFDILDDLPGQRCDRREHEEHDRWTDLAPSIAAAPKRNVLPTR